MSLTHRGLPARPRGGRPPDFIGPELDGARPDPPAASRRAAARLDVLSSDDVPARLAMAAFRLPERVPGIDLPAAIATATANLTPPAPPGRAAEAGGRRGAGDARYAFPAPRSLRVRRPPSAL